MSGRGEDECVDVRRASSQEEDQKKVTKTRARGIEDRVRSRFKNEERK